MKTEEEPSTIESAPAIDEENYKKNVEQITTIYYDKKRLSKLRKK